MVEQLNNFADACVVGKTVIVGDGSVLKPGYVCYNKASGDIVSVSDKAPT